MAVQNLEENAVMGKRVRVETGLLRERQHEEWGREWRNLRGRFYDEEAGHRRPEQGEDERMKKGHPMAAEGRESFRKG